MRSTRVENFGLYQLKSLVALREYACNYGLFDTPIWEQGYNNFSGNVYVAFEGGITLAIFEGRTKESDIIIYGFNYDTGEEKEYQSIEEYYKLTE
jgi:hypothetical protein